MGRRSRGLQVEQLLMISLAWQYGIFHSSYRQSRLKISIKDFISLRDQNETLAFLVPSIQKTSACGIGCELIMWEIINSVFLKKFHSLPEG